MVINLERTSGIRPDGVYQMRIKEIEEKQGSKAPYLALRLEFVKFSNSPLVFTNVSTSPEARFMLEAFLDAIQAPTSGRLSSAKLRGKTFFASIGNESYQGRLKNVVTAFLTPEAAQAALSDASTEEESRPVGTASFDADGEEDDADELSAFPDYSEEEDEEDEDTATSQSGRDGVPF